MKIEVKNMEDITPELLVQIATSLLEGDVKVEQAEKIKETVEKSPSLEEMKSELETYKKTIDDLVKNIKQEEKKLKKDTHHLIEKKVRHITFKDEVVKITDNPDYIPLDREYEGQEVIKYERKGNSVICTLIEDGRKYKGACTTHHSDKFDYHRGMMLSKARVMKEYWTHSERLLTEMF